MHSVFYKACNKNDLAQKKAIKLTKMIETFIKNNINKC